MGLKCSVLGHRYGNPSVESDREEQGSEVVITIREIETCERCGEERIVSENKEVTSLETPDDPVTDESLGDVDDERDAVRTGDESPDENPTGVSSSETTPGGTGRPSTVNETTSTDVNEGAEIMDDESDPPVTDDELAEPSVGDGSVGSDAMTESQVSSDSSPQRSVEDDAVIIDDEGDSESEREPGEWPEEPDTGTEDGWTPSDEMEDDSSNTSPDADAAESRAMTVADGLFRCPVCDFTTQVESSSLRAGDFCPECRKGSLVHDPEDETRKA